MNELKLRALELAINTDAKGEDVLSLTRDFYAWLNGDDAAGAPTGDAPKATRGRKSNAASAPVDTAASEPSSPSDAKPTLVADEGNADAEQGTAASSGAVTSADTGSTTSDSGQTAQTNASPSEATQEQKDALLAEATRFSQTHGHDALLGALKAVGAERFSAIPFAKYGDFRSAMAGHAAGASALS